MKTFTEFLNEETDTLFYHGTSSVFADKIKREGLRPAASKRQDFGSQNIHNLPSREESVYLSKSKRDARDYADVAAYAKGGHPVVLSIRVPASEMSKLVGDEQEIRERDSWRHIGPIPPAWIVAIERV